MTRSKSDDESTTEPHTEVVADKRQRYVSQGNLRRADQHLEAAFERLQKARDAVSADGHLHDVDLDTAEGQFDRWLVGAIAQTHDVLKMVDDEYEQRKQADEE